MPLYWFSFCVPRDKNLWVFGAWYGQRYADNSRFVFEYVRQHDPGIRAVWLSRSPGIVARLRLRGYECHTVTSLRGFWLSCRAGVVFCSSGRPDVNRPGITRAWKVQLWHGIPMKRIGMDAKRRNDFSAPGARIFAAIKDALPILRSRLFPFTAEDWDIVVATSPAVARRMVGCYHIPATRVAVLGYPRNDILLGNERPPCPVVKKLNRLGGIQKFVLYAPTFRHRLEDNTALFRGLDLTTLESCLHRHKALFLIKMHYAVRNLSSELRVPSDYVVWLGEADVDEFNELLCHVDVLLTDYSGACYDFLLLDRPIVFAPFDLSKYQDEPGMYDSYEAAAPGVKCSTWSELIWHLDGILSGVDSHSGQRQEAISRFHSFRDSQSSKRAYELGKRLCDLGFTYRARSDSFSTLQS